MSLLQFTPGTAYLERHQHAEELPLVADQAAVAEDWQLLHHLVLNENRRNVLPASCDDQLLGGGGGGGEGVHQMWVGGGGK